MSNIRWHQLREDLDVSAPPNQDLSEWDDIVTGIELDSDTEELIKAAIETGDACAEDFPSNVVNILTSGGLIDKEGKFTDLARECVGLSPQEA